MGVMFSGANLYISMWLLLMIAFVVVELITVGLTSIWFAAGALGALIFCVAGAGFPVQVVIFLVLSFGLLAATRPWAKKFINSKVTKTNSDSIVGQEIRITERVSNLDQTGTAVVNGQEWTVRTDNDKEVIEAGELATVITITGVKLIVKKTN